MLDKNKYLVSSEKELTLAKERYKIFINNYNIEPEETNFIVEFEGINNECSVIYPLNKINNIELKKGSLETKSMLIDLNAKNFQTKIDEVYYVLFFDKK